MQARDRRFLLLWLLCCLLAAGQCLAGENTGPVQLPRAMAWSAYNLGTTGYNQAVGIAKMLRDRHRVTLRVIPGKNDISRLLPLRVGRVQFTANGIATWFAQEGMFQFAHPKWGPMRLRLVMMSVGLSNQAVAVPGNSDIYSLQQLRGKRVAFVRGAPAINISTEAHLACGGIGWEHVQRVEFPGYAAMWNGVVDGHIDLAYATTISGPTRKLEASPRGIRWLPVPHQDADCWARLLTVAPYFTKHMATRGAGISEEHPHEGANYPYPLLITFAEQDESLVYNLARALHQGYEDYRYADPGSIGWALARQLFDWVVPFHAGAVRYFRQAGVWTSELDRHNQQLVHRQKILEAAWQELLAENLQNNAAFTKRWRALRALRLEQAGFDPIWH